MDNSLIGAGRCCGHRMEAPMTRGRYKSRPSPCHTQHSHDITCRVPRAPFSSMHWLPQAAITSLQKIMSELITHWFRSCKRSRTRAPCRLMWIVLVPVCARILSTFEKPTMGLSNHTPKWATTLHTHHNKRNNETLKRNFFQTSIFALNWYRLWRRNRF